MFKWLCSIFQRSEEDKKIIEALNKLDKEYIVQVRGGYITKVSRPEYKEKHKQQDREFAEKIKGAIEND